ncbi:MAG: NADPH:quinone oxidoreductase family protein [Pseudomonadota bacterium]
MRAFLSNAPGGPDTLELTEMDDPTPGKRDVVVAVKAAGVNFPDTLIIRDLYQLRPPRPFAPGGEVAGVIEAVGEDVTHLKVGQRVLALPGFGGFVTHLKVPAAQVVPIPDDMPFEDAACFIFTYGTSHYALKNRAKVQEGESLLVIGAAGGVGAAAIELGKAMGAKVIAAVSSDEKAAFCRELGADDTIVYPFEMDRDAQKEFSGNIKAIAGRQGVDVVYDAVGGAYAEPAVRALAWEGRFLVVGFPAGIPSLPLNLTLLKGCQVMGVFWGAFTQRDPKTHEAYLRELFQWYAEGKIKPRVSASFPLEQAPDAIRMLEDRKVLGKVVVTME